MGAVGQRAALRLLRSRSARPGSVPSLNLAGISCKHARLASSLSTHSTREASASHDGGRAARSDSKRDEARAELEKRDSLSPFLVDRYSRQHSYLRISLTERCNFRCLYCMPLEGVPLTPKQDLLTAREIERLAGLFVREGVTKIRLTGGEPTVRKDLPEIVSALSKLRSQGLRQIGMTTNGLTLSRHLPHLIGNGLTHLNISLDTLDPFKFELMTRTPAQGFHKVLHGIEEAMALGVPEVKINVVVIRGLNDGKDILDFVEWAKDKRVTIRFIEYMPFDGNRWRPEKLVPYSELIERITERYGVLNKVTDEANDTSKHWTVPGHRSKLGFITSMTEHFCGTCNRLRITADGNLKVCLFGNAEVSLRDAMRTPSSSGGGVADDGQLLAIVGAAVKRKHARHAGMGDPTELAKATRRTTVGTGLNLGSMLSPVRDAPHSLRAFSTSCRIYERRPKGTPQMQSWSEYMGSDGDDSPWASLDEFADTLADSSSSNGGGEKGDAAKAPTEDAHPAVRHSVDEFEAAAAAAAEAFASSRLRQSTGPVARAQPPPQLTHVDRDDNDRAAMVDISDKRASHRSATAACRVYIPDEILPLLLPEGTGAEVSDRVASTFKAKGPVLHTAQLAGILAAKRTSELIPLCHGLHLSHVDVRLEVVRAGPERSSFIAVRCTATTNSGTGVEMEALTGASVAALTVWDMLKSVGGRQMRIDGLMVTHKTGGNSGDFERLSD